MNDEPIIYSAQMDTAEKAVEVLKHLNPDAVGTEPEPTPEGEIPALMNLSPEQQLQLDKLRRRMEMYNQSRSGHKPGDNHTIAGVSYVVSESGAYKRMTPKVSRKAQHKKNVAARRSGRS